MLTMTKIPLFLLLALFFLSHLAPIISFFGFLTFNAAILGFLIPNIILQSFFATSAVFLSYSNYDFFTLLFCFSFFTFFGFFRFSSISHLDFNAHSCYITPIFFDLIQVFEVNLILFKED